jgi:hypothetical protein
MKIENDDCIKSIKDIGFAWVDKILSSKLTLVNPGSILYLLYGRKLSEQSINVKMGKFGEFLSKELIKTNNNLELLDCGIQQINNKNKDIDLIFEDKVNKIIYYRELKANIRLDTEKTLATITKCKEIENSLKTTYLHHTINCAILNWSVYNRKILTEGLSNIKTFENENIRIEHIEDFLNLINIFWEENDFYSYFKEIGNKITLRFSKN